MRMNTRTIVLGRIPVRNGQMKKVKKFYDDGELIGRITVKGTFTGAARVKGTVEWEDRDCTGDEDWRARRIG